MAGFRLGLILLIAAIGLVSVHDLSMATDDGDAALDIESAKQEENIEHQLSGIEVLGDQLRSGKPVIAYFYQSVACSCVAAQCSLAAAVTDSVPDLEGNDKFCFAKVDVFYTDDAESLFKVDIVPAFVYFDKTGKEINRLEWDISVELLRQLINHPEKKLNP